MKKTIGRKLLIAFILPLTLGIASWGVRLAYLFVYLVTITLLLHTPLGQIQEKYILFYLFLALIADYLLFTGITFILIISSKRIRRMAW
jgi:hypothetical protein